MIGKRGKYKESVGEVKDEYTKADQKIQNIFLNFNNNSQKLKFFWILETIAIELYPVN